MKNLLQKTIADNKNYPTLAENNQPSSKTSHESRENSIDEEDNELIAQLLKHSENGT